MTPLRSALTGFISIWCRSGLGRQETKHLIWGESMGALLGHGPGPQSSPCRGRRFSDRIDVRTGGTDGREEDDRLAKDSAGPPLTFLAFPLRSIGRLRMQRLKGLEAQMKLKPDRQLSLTDPE
jgi:hypothetical protein